MFCKCLQLLNLRAVSDPDKCRKNYKIFFYHFYMTICLIEWFGNGGNFMLIACPVFEIYKTLIDDVISVIKCTCTRIRKSGHSSKPFLLVNINATFQDITCWNKSPEAENRVHGLQNTLNEIYKVTSRLIIIFEETENDVETIRTNRSLNDTKDKISYTIQTKYVLLVSGLVWISTTRYWSNCKMPM